MTFLPFFVCYVIIAPEGLTMITKQTAIKKWVLFFVILFTCVFVWKRESDSAVVMAEGHAFADKESIALSVPTGNSVREISLWESPEGMGYFFLPSYASPEECCFIYEQGCLLALQGIVLQPAEPLKKISLNVPYLLAFQDKDGQLFTTEVMLMQSAKLPTVYIDTESGSLEYIHADKANKESAGIEIVDEDGQISYYSELEYIKGHGNQTWSFDKRPYQIKLQEEAELLGMGSGDKWLLMANRYDPSHIRNSVVHGLAEAAGMPYTSQMRYADLYINGEYKGNYQLAEKIDIGQGRVDIKNLEKENNKLNGKDHTEATMFGNGESAVKGTLDMDNPRDITGGYLLERNYGDKYDSRASGFITEAGEKFIVRSPAYASEEEIGYISGLMQHVENAILSPDGIDHETGLLYTELLDLDSFVKKYLIEEITLNEANGATSSWFYKPEDAVSHKVYAGPVWDYDKALGRRGDFQNPNLLTKLCCYNREPVKWFYALYEKKDFREKVKSDYQNIFLPELERMIDEEIDTYAEQIRESMMMDQVRWSDTSDLPSYGENDFSADVTYLKEWLKLRRDFLDRVWIQNEEVCLIRYQDEDGKIYPFTSVPAGSALTILPEGEDMELDDGSIVPFCGWQIEGSGKPCDVGEVITEDIMLLPIYE